jgi:molybdopterin/thiamine biosynthesis adenylyltransferase
LTSVRTPFRYGAFFDDQTTGLRFEAHHPAARPDRWIAYLEGAAREFARYGLGDLVDRRTLERAEGVPLFFVGVDADDQVVAGLRCYGPLEGPAASQALAEMARSPEAGEHERLIAATAPYGVIESKGAWRKMSGGGDHRVADILARCPVHALEWLGAEVAVAAVADRIEAHIASSGGRKLGHEAAPYPDERYRTIMVAWRRSRYGPLATPEQAALLRDEARQLRTSPGNGASTGWAPVILDTSRRMDRQILSNLRTDPAIDFVDSYPAEQAELRRLIPAPEEELLDESARHVYFPWRRVVVRMLGPRAFPVVRLDRNRNRITRQEQVRLRGRRVGVVGLSTGHSAATTIALEGLCGELRLADFDDIELTNLNRLPATVLDLGVNKAVVAARRIAEIDPYLPVRIVPEGLRPTNVDEFVAGLDVLVEECDDIAMKALVREVARHHGVPVVMDTSDRGMLDVERFDREPGRPIFHGLLPGVTAGEMEHLSVLEKIPHVLRLVDPAQASARGAASLAEIGVTLSTWPQLASDVTLGGASVATTVRRLGIGEPVPSGRIRVDVESLLETMGSPAPPEAAPWVAAVRDPLPEDPAEAIVYAACLAPSGGNAQPWRFELNSNTLAFELDRSKTSSMDVRFRGSYVALGAALFNARVAAAAVGRLGPVELFPDGAGSDVVARLTLGDDTDPALAELYPALLDRCANRQKGTPAPIDLSVAAQVATAARTEGGSLHLVTDQARLQTCAEILGAAERIRFLLPHLHREMLGELRFAGEDIRSGIDVRSLELGTADQATLEVVRRGDVMALLSSWNGGMALGANARGAVLSSSAVAVVTVRDASPAAYVRGGAAVERVWIEAQRSGLAVQPVSPVFIFAVQQADYDKLGDPGRADELRALSRRFRDVVDIPDTTEMALVLRFSHAPEASVQSLRRPIDEVLQRGH